MAVKDKKYQLGTAENKAVPRRGPRQSAELRHEVPGSRPQLLLAGRRRHPMEGPQSRHLDHLPHDPRVLPGRIRRFPGCRGAGRRRSEGLKGALHDDVNDGWYPEITPEGGYTPTKQCYAHAFVRWPHRPRPARSPRCGRTARHAEKVFLDKFWDDETGLSVDTWNTEFTELDPYRGLNANMHSVEAFLAVADVTGDETWRKRAGRIIEHVLGWAKANNWRIPEHFHSDWSLDLECNREKPDDQFKPYGARLRATASNGPA